MSPMFPNRGTVPESSYSVPPAILEAASDVRTVNRVETHQLSRRYLGYLLLVILAIKFVFYLLDPQPRFLLGDSASYLWTALTGWIPEDRSFTIGFILRVLAVWPHSFQPMILVQAGLSGISS